MGTAIENIFSARLGREARAGELVIVEIDASVIQDVNGPPLTDAFEQLGAYATVRSPKRHMMTLDHISPAASASAANNHNKMRAFARRHGLELVEEGQGICHQRMVESGRVRPGTIVLGTDSHCCHYGVLNAFSAGVSVAEEAVILAGDRCWLRIPESIRVTFAGRPASNVTGKDLALAMVRELTQSGAIYQCLEFDGEALRYLSIDGRTAICNMGIEAGAKGAIMPYDDILRQWLEQRGISGYTPAAPDASARYTREITIDASSIRPLVALPPDIDHVVCVDNLERISVNQVVVGGCTNGRLEDFAQVAAILEGRQIHPDVRFVAAPASREIVIEMERQGIYRTLLEAGVMVLPPGCGPCTGLHGGLLGDGDVCLATTNRNMPGRMGSRRAEVYIASPVVAAYTALAGYITAGGDAHC